MDYQDEIIQLILSRWNYLYKVTVGFQLSGSIGSGSHPDNRNESKNYIFWEIKPQSAI